MTRHSFNQDECSAQSFLSAWLSEGLSLSLSLHLITPDSSSLIGRERHRPVVVLRPELSGDVEGGGVGWSLLAGGPLPLQASRGLRIDAPRQTAVHHQRHAGRQTAWQGASRVCILRAVLYKPEVHMSAPQNSRETYLCRLRRYVGLYLHPRRIHRQAFVVVAVCANDLSLAVA